MRAGSKLGFLFFAAPIAALGLALLGPPGQPAASSSCGPGEHASGEDPCLAGKPDLVTFTAALRRQSGRAHRLWSAAGERRGIAKCVADELNIGYRKGSQVRELAESVQADIIRDLPGLGLLTLRLPRGRAVTALQSLEARSDVLFAEPNYVVRTAARPNDPLLPNQRALERAEVLKVFDQPVGGRVVVAVLDTGLDTNHPDLQGRIVPGYDSVNGSATMRDDNGHGTAIAGIIAAISDNNIGIAGIAQNAVVMPIKVADRDGIASVADFAAGLKFAVDQGARVVNMSLGTRVPSRTLELVIRAAHSLGAVMIGAAGNDPVHHAVYPAAYDEVIAVTVTGDEPELGYSAVLAEEVEVGAPGEDIPATLPGGVYGFMSGSSASSAFATAVAAVVWGKDPTLARDDVRQVLRAAQDPIPALEPVRGTYRFGRLNALSAWTRASRRFVDIDATAIRVRPVEPVSGVPSRVSVEVVNQGTSLPRAVLALREELTGGASRAIGAVNLGSMNSGERRTIVFNWTPSGAGLKSLRAELGLAFGQPSPTGAVTVLSPGDQVPANNLRRRKVKVVSVGAPDLRVVERRIITPATVLAGRLRFEVVIENVGSLATVAPVVSASVAGATLKSVAVPGLAAAPQGFQSGARKTLTYEWLIPQPAPKDIVRFEVSANPVAGEQVVFDNHAALDLIVGSDARLHGLYQQSNGVDVIPDAPLEIVPNRPYVPVQIFIPSKGDAGSNTRLQMEEARIDLLADPQGGGRRRLYTDTRSAPSQGPVGLTVSDELGARRPGLDLFAGKPLTENGHHDVLRLPRSEFGVSAVPPSGATRFLDVSVSWSYERVILWVFRTTRKGRHRKVLKINFLASELPNLPGQNHYYDVHHHTIAEWTFGSPLDLFAPRKAYGGSIQMIKESAWMLGLTPAVDDVYGLVITTDHNAFNNSKISDPNGWQNRPPFGETSITAQPGSTELEAYRNLFGPAAGEELAFKQNVPLPKVHPIVDRLLDLLPGLPIGGHMLIYGNDHIEGPWHGGGFLGGPKIDVELHSELNKAAKSNQGRQGQSFAYAAHPFGGQGWRDENLERGLGLAPRFRDRSALHDASKEFVLKGVQFFNGSGRRKLKASNIDFRDLNPWANSEFAKGHADWDSGLQKSLILWHGYLTRTLDYAFVSEPQRRFIRKIYMAGGSDAHGDFNFATGRLATPLSLSASFSVDDGRLFGTRTYVLADGKPGAASYDRYMAAYADGNTVVTDGPLVRFSIDGNTRWNSATQQWHDANLSAEDSDGRIGGGGAYDGGRTLLVRRGTSSLAFRYRYAEHINYGSNGGKITAIHIHKDELGKPNPSHSVGGRKQLMPMGRLAPAGPDKDLSEELNPAEEGSVQKLSAFTLAAYTGGDPSLKRLAVDERRCYTNPIWAAPYDVTLQAQPDPGAGTIPAGRLQMKIDFDSSMDPSSADFVLKALDSKGNSSNATQPVLALLEAASGTGWSDHGAVGNGTLSLVNKDPIPLAGAAWPSAGEVSFVVYSRKRLRDAGGNELNSIAFTFRTGRQGSGGTVVSGSSTGAVAAAPKGGGSGGSGFFSCRVAHADGGDPWSLLCLALLLGGLAVTRRRL